MTWWIIYCWYPLSLCIRYKVILIRARVILWYQVWTKLRFPWCCHENDSKNLKELLLPELQNRWAHAFGLQAAGVGFIGGDVEGRGQGWRGHEWRVIGAGLAEVQCAVGCVPFVATGGPGQMESEGVNQEIQAPRQDHDVISVTEEHNHHGCQT